jgi:uncharacterized DUF497 family protein
MLFEWDERKGKKNLAKHDVDFQTAELVFDDPYAVTIRDLVLTAKKIDTSISAILASVLSSLSSTRGLPIRARK